MVPPATNSTYQQTLFAPYVQCGESTPTASLQIDAMISRTAQALDPSFEIISTNFFAAVPSSSHGSIPSSPTVPVTNLNVDGAGRSSNELYISIPQYSDPRPTASSCLALRYIVCALTNASYRVRFNWRNGIHNTEILDRTVPNLVPYLTSPNADAASELDMSFSTVMWALGTQLLGSIRFQCDRNTTAAGMSDSADGGAGNIYSDIETDMARTILIGALDLNGFFEANHFQGASANNSSLFSPQRIQDQAYARNRTFTELLEELSSNITPSLLADPLLAWVSILCLIPALSLIGHQQIQFLYQRHRLGPGACLHVPNAEQTAVLRHRLRRCARGQHSGSARRLPRACLARPVFLLGSLRDVLSPFLQTASPRAAGGFALHRHVAKTRLKFYQGEGGRWGFGAVEEPQDGDGA